MDRIQPLRIMAGHLSDVDVSILLSVFIGSYIFFLHFKIIIVIALFGSSIYSSMWLANALLLIYLISCVSCLSNLKCMAGFFTVRAMAYELQLYSHRIE